jgi:hypothetical protein
MFFGSCNLYKSYIFPHLLHVYFVYYGVALCIFASYLEVLQVFQFMFFCKCCNFYFSISYDIYMFVNTSMDAKIITNIFPSEIIM